MAGKKSATGKFKFQGFINLEFTPDQRESIETWMDTFGTTPVDAILELVEAGWKVAIGWDDYHGTCQAALTCKDESSKYCGYCFTLKHDDPGKALLVFRYLYDAQLKNELYRLETAKGDFGW